MWTDINQDFSILHLCFAVFLLIELHNCFGEYGTESRILVKSKVISTLPLIYVTSITKETDLP